MYVSSMSQYIPRPLAQMLKESHRKVVILEGARAVGKTMLVQHELPGYHYETLADAGTYSYAAKHLDEWVSTLQLPVIIDEAQRLNGLPLAVKNVVDAVAASRPQFVLTGSASITRQGLSGQDPLTRRSQRFTLSPLTRREFNGNASTSVIDSLWDDKPNENYQSTTTRSDLLRFIETGGFPQYLFDPLMVSKEERRLSIRDDIDNVLGDTILPDEHLDKAIAESVLRELLTVPGGILNFKRIADSIGRDVRTVERYVSMFVRRFLVFTLPNLKAAANRQTLSRAKVHPVDTSFSAESFLQAGKDIAEDRALFGQIFESFVATQIIPEVQWSDRRPRAFYWRESGKHPKEVDLIFLHEGELIGVEVKSRDKVERDDFAALARLRDTDKRFKRGFVVYTGATVVQFADNMWAIPVSALWDGDGFVSTSDEGVANYVLTAVQEAGMSSTVTPADSGKDGGTTGSMNMSVESDANIFLSYRHDDDSHLNGAIVSLAEAIVQEYAFEFGSTLTLFIDKRSINWGDEWRTVLARHIDRANIIIPAITPQYMLSEQCRKELLDFNAQIGVNKGNRILPLLWQNIDHVQGIGHHDPVWTIAHDHQWLSAEDFRYLTPGSPEYQRKVAAIVANLRKVIDDQNAILDDGIPSYVGSSGETGDKSDTPQMSQDQPTALERLAEVQTLTPRMNDAANLFSSSVKAVTETMSSKPFPQDASPADMLQWGNDVAEMMKPHITAMNTAMDGMTTMWDETYKAMESYVQLIVDMPRGSARNSQIVTASTMLDSMMGTFTYSADVEQSLVVLRMMGNLMRQLKPLAQAFERAVNLSDNMKTMVGSLLDRLNRLPR